MKYHTADVMSPRSPNSMLSSEFCVWWPSKKTAESVDDARHFWSQHWSWGLWGEVGYLCGFLWMVVLFLKNLVVLPHCLMVILSVPIQLTNPLQWQEAAVRSCAETLRRGSEICFNPSKNRKNVDILLKKNGEEVNHIRPFLGVPIDLILLYQEMDMNKVQWVQWDDVCQVCHQNSI